MLTEHFERMSTTTLSSKYQIVIPAPVRERMHLRAGTKVTLYPLDDDYAIIAKRPVDPVSALKGLGKEVWQALGGGEKYIKQERNSWRKRF